MEVIDVHSLVAAILTIGSLDNTGHSARIVVNRYAEIQQMLLEAGGHREPTKIDRNLNLP